MAAAGSAAAVLQAGAISLAAAHGAPNAAPNTVKPRVRVAFVRPDVDRYQNTWPGEDYDPKGKAAEYLELLARPAKQLDVEIEAEQSPLADDQSVAAFAQRVKAAPPDGVILVVQILNGTAWRGVRRFVESRGDAPTYVFAQQGTFFLDSIKNLAPLVEKSRAFIAATPDVEWLSFGLRALAAIRRMKDTRICVVQGTVSEDVTLAPVGTTLHYIPVSRFPEEYRKVGDSDEARELAAHYTKRARKIVEPTAGDVLDAAKTYIVCRRLMEAEGCNGIAVECLPFIAAKQAPAPCLAFSRLLDEGVVAGCQADWPAAISLRLCELLLGQPGFMNNTCVSTTSNTRVGAHCTCPTRLAGADQPAAPFILRSHDETNSGVAMQVLWPANEEITVMKFSHPDWSKNPKQVEQAASSMLLGAGRVLRNLDTPPNGGCRTSLEVRLDGVAAPRPLNALHHQLFMLGNHVRKFEVYCRLAGIETKPL